MPQFCIIHGINTAAQTLATLCEDIRREGIQCDENSLANLSSGGKVRNWRWLTVLYNVVSKTVVGVVVPGLSMMAKAVLLQTPGGPLAWRFRPENQDARQYMICVCREANDYQTWTRPCRERGVLTLTNS